MDECLQLLIQARECPFDESFAHQVKLQLIWREYENVNFSSVPPAFCLKTLYSKLNEVKSSMSPQLQENGESIAGTTKKRKLRQKYSVHLCTL